MNFIRELIRGFLLSNTWIVHLSLYYSYTSYECTQSDYWRTVNNPFHLQKNTTAESIIKIRHSEQGLVSQYLINLANFLRIVLDEFQCTVFSNRTSLCLNLILIMVSPPHSRILSQVASSIALTTSRRKLDMEIPDHVDG